MSVEVLLNPIRTYIKGALEEEVVTYIDEQLQYLMKGYFFTNRYMAGKWDGSVKLMYQSTKLGVSQLSFRTGFWPRIERALELYQVDYTVLDFIPKYEWSPVADDLDGIELRDYQKQAVDKILTLKRGIVHAVPRSGKTIIAIDTVRQTGIFPIVFIIERLDLAYQTKEKFEKFLPEVDVGIVGDGQCDLREVTIITIQSTINAFKKEIEKEAWYKAKMSKAGKKKQKKPELLKLAKEEYKEKNVKAADRYWITEIIKRAKVVFVDEGHHIAAASYQYVLRQIESAEIAIALSGTPWREDGEDMKLEMAIGPVFHRTLYTELIEKGFLVPLTVVFYKLPKSNMKDAYATVYKKCITENGLRNRRIRDVAVGLAKQNMSVGIVVTRKKHGELLKRYIPKSVFLHGAHKTRTRQTIYKAIGDKKKLILISTLINEGIDIPSLDAVIVACGGDSGILVFQRLRCMTPFKGKERCYLIDFHDNVKYLSRHSKHRLDWYKKEKSFKIIQKKVNAEDN